MADLECGIVIAPHGDPHDSNLWDVLRCRSRSVGKYPTHRSKSWEELAKKGAHVVPSRRTKLDGDKGWNRISQEQGGALLFFCPLSTQPTARRAPPKTA